MGNVAGEDRMIRGEDDLLEPFHDAIKPRSKHRIGAEAEKFGVDATTGAALPYDGERSVVRVLEALVARHGWKADYESPGGPLIALSRSGASVTLEPGGQLELSGAPLDTIHQVCSESRGHMAELRDISQELNLTWLGVGFHPFARQEDLPWVPKARYGVMRRWLPLRGQFALDMMRRTATVQANFDYASEEDAMRSLRLSLKLSPIVTAMFANSPFYEGKPFGGKSYRARVWLDVDPDRQGLLGDVLERGKRFRDYVEWALDIPMFVVKRGSTFLENTGQTFRSFMLHGFKGEKPTLADWETHLNTLFPEVRLKRTLEVRGADSLPAPLQCALPALWTGLLYDDVALAGAEELVAGVGFAELEVCREGVSDKALGAELAGKPVRHYAERLMDLASAGLGRRARVAQSGGDDERVHLSRLATLVGKGWCPADALLDGIDGATDLRKEILERSKI